MRAASLRLVESATKQGVRATNDHSFSNERIDSKRLGKRGGGEKRTMSQIYLGRRLEDPVVLKDAKHDGFRYAILSLGSHPTAYVEIPRDHPLFEKDYDDIELEVHGGLTYSDRKLRVFSNEKDSWWIGWDYAHYNDFCDYERSPMAGKKWTLNEIEAEVFEVIEQLKEEKKSA